MSPGKPYESVIRAFDAAAATYDAASQVQREIARELVFRAAHDFDGNPKRILDLGSGAGHATDFALQRWPDAEMTALDAAPAMLAALQAKFPGVRIIRADAAETGDIGRYDLILSSMMAHWLPDPRQAIAQWRRLLAPRGKLHVALPVAGSLTEWRDACAAAGVTDGLWSFPQADFDDMLCEKVEIAGFLSRHASGKAFLQSLKATGARLSPPGHRPVSPAALRHMLAALDGPFSTTFRIAFLTLAGGPSQAEQ